MESHGAWGDGVENEGRACPDGRKPEQQRSPVPSQWKRKERKRERQSGTSREICAVLTVPAFFLSDRGQPGSEPRSALIDALAHQINPNARLINPSHDLIRSAHRKRLSRRLPAARQHPGGMTSRQHSTSRDQATPGRHGRKASPSRSSTEGLPRVPRLILHSDPVLLLSYCGLL